MMREVQAIWKRALLMEEGTWKRALSSFPMKKNVSDPSLKIFLVGLTFSLLKLNTNHNHSYLKYKQTSKVKHDKFFCRKYEG